MKTRTLLLLALACGLAIMLAGAVFLFQLAGQDQIEDPAELGVAVDVGDMQVTVESSTEAAGRLVVSVRMGGTDDADGASGFGLIASGRPVTPDPAGTCGATSPAVEPCTLEFDVAVADTSSRVLFYRRGDERAHWVLG